MPSPSLSPRNSSKSKSRIDELEKILCIKHPNSTNPSWRKYKICCSDSYLSWLSNTDPRHAGLLRHVLDALDNAIANDSQIRREFSGKYVMNAKFFPPAVDKFKESTQFVRLVITREAHPGGRTRTRSTRSTSSSSSSVSLPKHVSKPIEYVFLWDAYLSDDKSKTVADVKLMKLLSEATEERGKKWTTLVNERLELVHCDCAPKCEKMFLLNHGESLSGGKDGVRRGIVKPALARLRSSFAPNVNVHST
ncbi:hypothetical protein SCHPADRAFT_896157 [Schizopora paradoxa]|uniref:Uncharacterized protein n=1 Tax=Schizopora paradoxa TaxID=27342 RepID=A0A0H2RL66_9AGAM|nr:hypothetical protein SCHPADRAFT_896157 [Schizopora paradoxa]